MANKHDLKSWTCSGLVSTGYTHIGDSIPVGKTRFITFLEVSRHVRTSDAGLATGAHIMFGSTISVAATVTEVSAGRKFAVNLPQVRSIGQSSPHKITDEVMRFRMPTNPTMHPLFSVQGLTKSNFAGVINQSTGQAHVVSVATVHINAQYYDE